jgi:hypothetical protein
MELPMIGKNWMKGLAVAGVAAAVPVISNASTHYTGKKPASIAMMSAAGVTPLKKVSTKHVVTKHVLHHTAVKKAVVTGKLHKKHVALTTKKKHMV